MPESLTLPPVAQGVLAITAVALAVVRLLTASRPFWAWEKVPVWVQKLLPALLMAIAALPTALEHARSWLDVAVAFVVTGAMWFTASRGDKRPPEDKGGGPRTERVNSDPVGKPEDWLEPERTPPSLPGARMVGLLLGVAWLALVVTGCSLFGPRAAERCSFANPAYTAQVAACRQEIADTCLLNEDETPREDCPALMRCEEWRAKECQ